MTQKNPADILVSSNAPWAASGYGQQTSLLAPRLRDLGHNVALNCFYGLEGGMTKWEGMNCYPTDNTRFGSLELPNMAKHHGNGDALRVLNLTLMDVWVLLQGMQGFVENQLRFASWVPIDHDPVPPLVERFLLESGSAPIAMSKFGEKALHDKDFRTLYVPHGIDTNVYRPQHGDRAHIREALKIPPDAYVVGMVANNQGLPSRKAFPQVFDAFNQFRQKHTDALLYVHADIMGRNNGINLVELAKAFDIPPQYLRTSDQFAYHIGIPQREVANVYSSFDVLCMPSLGEGFGIPLVESQACGIPVITTDWTAMTELCGAGWLVQGEKWYDATQGSFQKIPYVREILDALEASYNHGAALAEQAREFALQYDIDTVFDKYWPEIIYEVTKPREIEPLRLAA